MVKRGKNRLCVARVSPGDRRYSPLEEELSMAKAAAAQTTVTLKHIAAALAGTHEMAKKQSETILGDFVGLVVKHLKKGDRIRIGGLGILQVRKRAARMGRNPATGEAIKIKASKKVAFRAAKELKEAV
jgi:DNA-binding protein HU-beta